MLKLFSCRSLLQEEEELRPSSRADDDPEVTQFYVNPIAKPIPQGRGPTSLQDTISDLNMHKAAGNGLEVRRRRKYPDCPFNDAPTPNIQSTSLWRRFGSEGRLESEQ